MTEGIKSKAKMAGLLKEELEALERQRDQYALAMDTATEPKVAIRLQRTLERIEDEIEGLEETIAALPQEQADETDADDTADADAGSGADAGTDPEPGGEPEPVPETPDEPEPPHAEGPDVSADQEWDDEPSTAIYDPDRVRSQLAELEAMRAREEAEAAEAQPEPNAAPEAEPEPEPEAEPEAEPEPEPEAEAEPESEAEPEPEPEAPVSLSDDADDAELEEPTGEGNPLGPVWMDPESPPAGNLSDDEIAEAAGSAPAPASPDVLGDDPFALPSAPAAAAAPEASSPFGSPAGDASPFGAPAADASPFGAAPGTDAPFGSPSPDPTLATRSR